MNMKQLMKQGIFVLAFICLIGHSHITKAQGDIDQLLAAIQEDVILGTEDANTLIEGYMAPFMNGLGLAFANGWANTAKPHKTAGFDLGIVAGLAFVPDKDLLFSAAGLNVLEVPTGASTSVPTIFGPDQTPVFQYKNDNSLTVNGIPGTDLKEEVGFSAVPYIIPQLGIGIVKGTDIKLRLLPKIELGEGDGELKVFGIGVMHDIKQHIPGIKNLPFELSALIGYTKMDLTTDFSDPNTAEKLSGEFSMKSLTIEALISREFSIITLYGGVGINSVSSSLKMVGDFTVDADPLLPAVVVSDPIDMSFNAGGPKLKAGFRLKLAILTITADYSLQKYSTFTTGIGFAVR